MRGGRLHAACGFCEVQFLIILTLTNSESIFTASTPHLSKQPTDFDQANAALQYEPFRRRGTP